MHEYKAKLVKVVDGDTLKLDIDLGFNLWHLNQNVRLADIDAPELRTKEGKEAKAYLKKMLMKGQVLYITTEKKGKYGRYVADVYLSANEQKNWLRPITVALVKDGHAVWKDYS